MKSINLDTIQYNQRESGLYFPANETGITHKDILARELLEYLAKNYDRNVISVISSGSFCFAMEMENILRHNGDFEIRVLVDERNTNLIESLKNSGLKYYATNLSQQLNSQDILRLTNNMNGLDVTNLNQFEDFEPYSNLAFDFQNRIQYLQKEIKNVFVPFGSGNLHKALIELQILNLNLGLCSN